MTELDDLNRQEARLRNPIPPGDRFGRLTARGWDHAGPGGNAYYYCSCDCGRHVVVCVVSLHSGRTRSCGCLQGELTAARNRANARHGATGTRTYKSWSAMLGRCTSPGNPNWPYYGGRGVGVCARWSPKQGGSFENFLADMGERPEGKTLDRIDVDGSYEPSNCRWATAREQRLNRTDTR